MKQTVDLNKTITNMTFMIGKLRFISSLRNLSGKHQQAEERLREVAIRLSDIDLIIQECSVYLEEIEGVYLKIQNEEMHNLGIDGEYD